MLKFVTSLSFLYALSILVLLLYGFFYYSDFARSGYQRKRFPYIFLIIGAACFSFLYFNIHASLQLKTFSNADHHFIRHDGFQVSGTIELGRSDTVTNAGNAYNSFIINKQDKQVQVSSSYSDEPFYAAESGVYRLLSVSYPATGHAIYFTADSLKVKISVAADSSFELSVGNNPSFSSSRLIKKGSSVWNLFKDNEAFINSPYYINERIISSLKNIFILRDDLSVAQSSLGKTGHSELKYFLSGKLFRFTESVKEDEKPVQQNDLSFKSIIADKSIITWGIGSLDNNRNQYRIKNMGNDSFALLNRYPVSYPLTEEKKDDWTTHAITKFLVSDQKDILNMPSVFKEGFLFSSTSEDSTINFSPVLLSYQKGAGNNPLLLKARLLNNSKTEITAVNNQLLLPAKLAGFSWIFSINNSFNWDFGSYTLTAKNWQLLLFGSLFVFFIVIFFTSLVKPADKLSWVWQLLSCVTLVLLTTRFFLYWRYKSFPPYEGMDLPSLQQLQSFWNFGIIIFACISLAFILGFGLFKFVYQFIREKTASLLNKRYNENYSQYDLLENRKIGNRINRYSLVIRFGIKAIYFASWIALLGLAFGLAAVKSFEPATCRHLAIGLMLAYFIYVFISYKYSPLVTSSDKSWWIISTGSVLDIITSNPVKVLLSISLLAIFVFIDIGFAIVFLNFLLFNEAFLCINYGIAGLSAGSRRNAGLFASLGIIYLSAFIINLIYAPFIFKYLLGLPQLIFITIYFLLAVAVTYNVVRLLSHFTAKRKILFSIASSVIIFLVAFFFFPKEKILEKAAVTKYRIDVMTMPVNKAIELAYEDGKTYEPVIRAAQNQWFINTFIYEKNNPAVNSNGFHLLPHAPQNKGAKYNAQATDLVASRFFIAEHGKWSVLLYVLLLLVPATLLASFYKLYPDFTNRINSTYPIVTAGFSVLNYLLITALLVILAATGRYIFFGQDMPFGSILSKQSVLFPSVLIVAAILLFKNIPLEQYSNRRKFIPGIIVFAALALLLFFVKPAYNNNKEFDVNDTARNMDSFIELRLQPILDYLDSSKTTRRFSMMKKDQLFTDSVKKLAAAGLLTEGGQFFTKEMEAYLRSGFSRHLDQNKMLYLDLYSGHPQLTANDNYFRVEPPPHLQQLWTGNVFGDSSVYNISLWNVKNSSIIQKRLISYTNDPATILTNELKLSFQKKSGENIFERLYLINTSPAALYLKYDGGNKVLNPHDSLWLPDPYSVSITDASSGNEQLLTVQPDAFMQNYYVNGSRFYVYPMGSRFIWARNFAESISSEYATAGQTGRNASVSFDFEMMDSLAEKIRQAVGKDTAYKKGAEYGICIADGNGKLLAMNDFIKEMNRPDPNNKARFNKAIIGENGFVSQSVLRKQIGNINLLRLNPGPGSTLKPVVFSAIASQLNLEWDAFATEGFTQPQQLYGGEKVAEYDFEKNNGLINKVTNYLKYSDNYYHSNVLLLGSYPKQPLQNLLSNYFVTGKPGTGLHWPYFSYKGQQYWLDGFANWPGYINGKANFGTDSSFVSTGLYTNYGIYTHVADRSFEKFSSEYDSLLFLNAARKSGFLLPEYALFDQQGSSVNHSIPYDVFASCFRGHVKGSSQVMVPPVKMLDAYGKLISQNCNYSLTLNPYAAGSSFIPFNVDKSIGYNNYLSIIREDVFEGMKEALFNGTAARLGSFLKNGSPYFYYAKTGTTGDNESDSKSKLFSIIISLKDVTDPGFNFRKNKFYTIYFTSQNGPAKQNEELQAAIIKYVQETAAFKRYMSAGN